MGCSPAAIAIFLLFGLAMLGGGITIFFPQLIGLITPSEVVIPSPTPTPTVPTATPTSTYTPTPTSTPTSTPTPTNTPISVAVPRLIGLNVKDAVVLAKQQGFTLLEIGRVESLEFPVDVVAQQDPAPDSIYQQTRTITVRVSKGPPGFTLPDFAMTDANEARVLLESAGMTVHTTQEGSVSVPEGAVIRTLPEAGTVVTPGGSITLVVSAGETVQVPFLVGIENEELAIQRLESIGLQVGAITEEDDPTESVPPGAVLRQNPPSGTMLKKYSTVDIVMRRKQ
jgi:serine/threonine-protein kinase